MAIEARTTSCLEEATRMLAVLQLELEHKGYPTAIVAAALSRARGMAHKKAMPISPDIRERAFLDLLLHELKGVEAWIRQEQQIRS